MSYYYRPPAAGHDGALSVPHSTPTCASVRAPLFPPASVALWSQWKPQEAQRRLASRSAPEAPSHQKMADAAPSEGSFYEAGGEHGRVGGIVKTVGCAPVIVPTALSAEEAAAKAAPKGKASAW